jgi:uncharacterized protein
MTQPNLPRKVRQYAMWCHLSGIFWILIYCVTFLIVFAVPQLWEPNINSTFVQILMLIAWGLSIFATFPFLMPLGFWLVNRNLHPFVDRAGKATINYTIAICIQFVSVFSLTFFISFVTCGIYNNQNAVLTTFFALTTIGTAAILIANIVTTIYAAIRASRGEIYHYPFSINLLK